jgi:hypothetical protein
LDLEVSDDDATFESLSRCELRFETLDSKLRTALARYAVGEQGNKHRELANVIVKATDDCKRRKVLIRGRQLLYLVFTFYLVDKDKRIRFDLMNITSVAYPGDAHMAKFLYDWDDMLDNMKAGVTLDQRFLEETLVGVIRKSDELKIYIDYYDRQFDDAPDRSYAYLHRTIAHVVLEKRRRLNKEALLVDHSASRRSRPPAAAAATTPDPTPAHKGKGKGKGKGQVDNGDKDSDTNSDFSGWRSDGGVRLIDMAYKDRCCIRNLWSMCEETVDGAGCRYGPHTPVVPECMKEHAYYLSMLADNGPPTLAAHEAPKPKGKGKGKGKGKDAAPAAQGEAAAELQQQ